MTQLESVTAGIAPIARTPAWASTSSRQSRVMQGRRIRLRRNGRDRGGRSDLLEQRWMAIAPPGCLPLAAPPVLAG